MPSTALTSSAPRNAAPSRLAPVAIFDSGLGGLSVLRAVRAALPDERLLYAADSFYAPYGERDDDFITDRTLAVGEWLVAQGAKALVVACNTATAQAIALARERLPIPVIGVEPGIKPAALMSQTRVIGVLATAATLRSQRFQSLIDRYAGDCRFMLQAGHGLVQAVERCDIDSPDVIALLRSFIEPMLDANVDTLVLGCTHYPFFDTAIRSITGDRLTLIDTSIAIARQLERQLDDHDLRAPPGTHRELPRLFSTNDGIGQQQLAAALLDLNTSVESIVVPSRRTLELEAKSA